MERFSKVDARTQANAANYLFLPPVKNIPEEDLVTTGLLHPYSRFVRTLLPVQQTLEEPESARNGILLYGAVGCAEDILVVPVLLHYKANARLLNLKTLENSNLKDHELILHIRKLFTTARVKQTATVIHILHAERLWTEPVSFRMERILVGLKCQLELLAVTNSKVFYFTHVADPWNIPKDLLVYFPTRIWLPPPPSPEGRVVAFKYFIQNDETAFLCSYRVSDEELLEICRHPSAKCLYWNDIRDIIRGALAYTCLSKMNIRDIPETGFTRSQRKKFMKVGVRKDYILHALETLDVESKRYEELRQLTDFMRDYSSIRSIPMGENHLSFTAIEDSATIDSPFFSEVKEFLTKCREKKKDEEEEIAGMMICEECVNNIGRHGHTHDVNEKVDGEGKVLSEDLENSVTCSPSGSLTADEKANSEGNDAGVHNDSDDNESSGVSAGSVDVKSDFESKELSQECLLGVGDLRIVALDEPLNVQSGSDQKLTVTFDLNQLAKTVSLSESVTASLRGELASGGHQICNDSLKPSVVGMIENGLLDDKTSSKEGDKQGSSEPASSAKEVCTKSSSTKDDHQHKRKLDLKNDKQSSNTHAYQIVGLIVQGTTN